MSPSIKGGRKGLEGFVVLLFILLCLSPVSFVRESIVSSKGKSEQLNENGFPSLSCVVAIGL